MQQDVQALKTEFLNLYGGTEHGIRVFHAPGRINLIGEHTDYNGGYVFPAALTFGTAMLIRPREDGDIHFASLNLPLKKAVNPERIEYSREDDWINYPKGMLCHLQKRGHRFGGYDVLYAGAIPNGAGLSSSASIQVVTGFGFLSMEGREIDRKELALIAQESENEFMGVNCGIMDQFTVAMGAQHHALLLKCSTLEYEKVPFRASGYKIVIGNTNKRRGLVDSAYNERRSQCEQAVRELKKAFPKLEFLAELTVGDWEKHEHLVADPVIRKRARHVITENGRVLQSVEALKKDDLQTFGRLMSASHASLRDDYEVSCRELDVMVEAAMNIEGVLGSRMTGAGFGGCTVSLVPSDRTDAFIRGVGEVYEKETFLKPDFYVADIGDGVREVGATSGE